MELDELFEAHSGLLSKTSSFIAIEKGRFVECHDKVFLNYISLKHFDYATLRILPNMPDSEITQIVEQLQESAYICNCSVTIDIREGKWGEMMKIMQQLFTCRLKVGISIKDLSTTWLLVKLHIH